MASVKKNFVFNILLVVSNILFPVLVFPYVARILGPDGLGGAQFALQFSKYFVVVASLGIPIYGMREVAKVRHDKSALDKLVSELFWLNAITAVISAVVYVFVISWYSKFQPNIELFYIAGFQVLFGFLSIDWLFGGLEDFKMIAVRSLVLRALTVVFLFLYVQSSTDVIPYLFISILSILLSHIWNLCYALSKFKLHIKGITIANHLKPIFLIFIMNVCISMYTIFDTAWVGLLSDDASVGLYNASLRLSKIAIPFITTLGLVLIPRSARAFAANNQEYNHIKKSFNFIIDIGVPLCIGMNLLAPQLLHLFSGSDFLPAYGAMRLLSFLPLVIGLSNLFGLQMLSAAGYDKQLLFCVFIGMVCHIALSVLLIPTYTFYGAALSIFITETLVTIITYIVVMKRIHVSFDYKRIVKAATLTILFYPCVIAGKLIGNTPLLTVIWSVFFCASSYVFLQYVCFKNEFVLTAIQVVKNRLNK